MVQKLTELAILLMQDILGNPKVQSVPSSDVLMPSQIEPKVDLTPHTHSNVVMKLAVIHLFWMHAHVVLPACTLAGSLSESLLTWLMEKEAELMVETDMPHNVRTQWAMLCAEVLVHTGVAIGYVLAAVQLYVFWGTHGASQPRVWNWCMVPPWYSLACHLHKSILSLPSHWTVLMLM